MSPPDDSRAVAAVRLMLRHAREAHSLAEHHSESDLATDRTFELCLKHLMTIVGEAGRRVPPEFRLRYPQTPWRGPIGLRDVLVHQFDTIDAGKLWEIIQDELPELIEWLAYILEAERVHPA